MGIIIDFSGSSLKIFRVIRIQDEYLHKLFSLVLYTESLPIPTAKFIINPANTTPENRNS
jgi:hypothetical protein